MNREQPSGHEPFQFGLSTLLGICMSFALFFALPRFLGIGGLEGLIISGFFQCILALAGTFWVIVLRDIARSFPHPDPSLRRQQPYD